MLYIIRILEGYTFVNVTQVTLFPPLANLFTLHSLCSLLFSHFLSFLSFLNALHTVFLSAIFCPLPLSVLELLSIPNQLRRPIYGGQAWGHEEPSYWRLCPICAPKWKVTQSCLTLYDPMGYTVHGILQARILEQVAFPFSRGSSQLRDRTQVSHVAGGFFSSWATLFSW